MPKPPLEAKFRLGAIVFLFLMVVEIVEFLVGTGMQSGAVIFLALLAVPGAALIVNYFMHILHLWRPEE